MPRALRAVGITSRAHGRRSLRSICRIFIADRDHLRRFGRPVTGDAYIAMDNGPVLSRIYDIIKGSLDFFGDPGAINAALTIKQDGAGLTINRSPPNLSRNTSASSALAKQNTTNSPSSRPRE
jgi:Protein of unknown function (DUF4065)